MKRYFAPLLSAIITAIIILLFGLFYFLIFRKIPGIGFLGYIFIAIAVISVGIMTAVLIQRIKEIKEGEEDDLGKY
jgi:multisubunit Na+/H+ antiporter MnhB subunit